MCLSKGELVFLQNLPCCCDFLRAPSICITICYKWSMNTCFVLSYRIWSLMSDTRYHKSLLGDDSFWQEKKTTWRDVSVCLTSGSHSCLAVWGDPIGHLSPSQSRSLAPSWSPATPPQSTPPDHPHSATKYHEHNFITSHAYYLIRVKSAQQSPAVNSCILDSSRSASKLTLRLNK